MPTSTQRTVMQQAGFRVKKVMLRTDYYWFYPPGQVRGMGSHGDAEAAWEAAWQYVLGGHSIAEVQHIPEKELANISLSATESPKVVSTAATSPDSLTSAADAIPSKEEAIDFAVEAMRKIKLSELGEAGYTVNRVPNTLGHAVYFDGHRINSTVHNSVEKAWDWACEYLTKDPKGGKVLVLRHRGFTVHHNEKDGLWWINHDNEPVLSQAYRSEQQAWDQAIYSFWDTLPGEVLDKCKSNVKILLEARDRSLRVKPLSSADLAKVMGFGTAEITKALDVVGKWLVQDKPLTREQLAQQRVYLCYGKDTGHFYWWDLDRSIESSRAWETEQEALDEANKWLRNFHIINRSDLK